MIFWERIWPLYAVYCLVYCMSDGCNVKGISALICWSYCSSLTSHLLDSFALLERRVDSKSNIAFIEIM